MDADPRDQRIKELEAENAQLRAENEALRELIRQLQQRIEQLERENARQAAPFRRKDKDRKPPKQQRGIRGTQSYFCGSSGDIILFLREFGGHNTVSAVMIASAAFWHLNSGDWAELVVRYVDPDNHYAVRIGKDTGGGSGPIELIHPPLVRLVLTPCGRAHRPDAGIRARFTGGGRFAFAPLTKRNRQGQGLRRRCQDEMGKGEWEKVSG